MSKRDDIRAKAVQIMGQEPAGIRWSDLVKRVEAALPGIGINNITGSLWNLDAVMPDVVYKPASSTD